MNFLFENRAADALSRCFPSSATSITDALNHRWRIAREDAAWTHMERFLTALPRQGWRCGMQDDIVRLSHNALHALPSNATEALLALKPWRKGPFAIADIPIDAEWRSEQKWARIMPLLPNIEGQIVLDIGSNNGYYGHRLLAAGADTVFGFDPQPLYIAQALCAEGLAPHHTPISLPIGLDALRFLPQSASLILLMGILYHQTDPLAALRSCARALRRGGHVLIETIVIPGTASTALFVPSRYTGAKGFYWLPTRTCLRAWITRANLRVVASTDAVATRPQEQRATSWRDGASLHEGLDPQNPNETIEGHPAPRRIALLCTRG